MSGCGNCKGGNCNSKSDCNSDCLDKLNTSISGPLPEQKEDIQYLKKRRYKKQDPTPLNYPCHHHRNTIRYMCIHCIREYVEAVGPEEAKKIKSDFGIIAEQRIEEAIKEYEHENPIF